MSRNRDRMGQPTTQHADPPQQALQENAGFSFVVPTEFVELPSGGRFYDESHPLHNQTTIEIKQMTAREEDLLTSPTLLKSGVAIERVIQSLIMDKRVAPDTLLVGDRNAILIAARISGYGSEYTTKVTCPACSTTQEHSFNLHELEAVDNPVNSALDITDNKNGTFTTILPRTGLSVEFKLLNGRDEKRMLSQIENQRKRKRAEANVTTQMKSLLVSVNGETSPQAIQYLVDNIPSIDSRHIRACYKLVNPNIDMSQFFTCQECGHEEELEVPLTADFFWPDR